MFNRHASKPNEQLTLIQRDIDELKDMGRETRTTLLGRDGMPGLMINFATLCQRVSGIETILNNDIAHLSAKMDTMFTAQEVMNQQRNMAQSDLKAKEESNTVRWSDLLKDWVKPIVVTIITAILTYFIVTSGVAK